MTEMASLAGVVSGVSREFRRALKHPLASEAGWLAASQYGSAVIGLLTTVVAARLLGPDAYGATSMITAYPNFLWSFVAIKSVSISTRYISSFAATDRYDNVKGICKLGYTLDFTIAAGNFLLVCASAHWIARDFFHLPGNAGLMIIYAASLLFSSLAGTSRAILTSRRRFRHLAAVYLCNEVLTFAIVGALLFSGFGVAGMVLGAAAGQASLGLIMAAVATDVLRRDGMGLWWTGALGSVAPLRQELLGMFGWNYLTTTLRGVMAQLPLMLIGALRGPQEAGFYRIALSFMTVGSYLETSLGQVVYPLFSARWGRGEKTNPRTLKKWTLRGGLPTGALVLAGIPLVPLVVAPIFGAAYLPMTPGIQILMIGAAVGTVFFWLNSFYYAFGKISAWTKAYGANTLIVIGLAWFFVQEWGFIGLTLLMALGKIGFTISMAAGARRAAESDNSADFRVRQP